MPTPILIPASNEAWCMERTLSSLAKQSGNVDPYVIVNGCTDNTADIASAAGATVLESEHGKMLALQEGLRSLGKLALDPVIILDADTRPVSKKWSTHLVAELGKLPVHQPGIVWGPVAFKDDLNIVLGTGITLYTTSVSWADRHDNDPRTIRGGNSGLKLHSSEVLEEILALDNYWPREDVAIYDTIMQNNGSSKVIFNYEAWAITSGYRYSPMQWLRQTLLNRTHPNRIADQEYDTRTPNGAKPYNSSYTRHSNKNPGLAK